MNIQRILKIELLLITIISILVVFACFLWESLPDNFYMITSVSSGVSFISYYLTSLLGFAAYLVGYWIIFPFVFFVLFYSFLYSKREFLVDTLCIFPLTLFFVVIFFIFFPAALGAGLYFILDSNISVWACVFFLPIFLFLFLLSSFRETFICLFLAGWDYFLILTKIKSSNEQSQIRSDGSSRNSKLLNLKNIFLNLKTYMLLKKTNKQSPLIIEETSNLPLVDSTQEEIVASYCSNNETASIDGQQQLENALDKKVIADTAAEINIIQFTPPLKVPKKKTDDADYFQIVNAFSKPKKVTSSVGPKNDYYEQIASAIQDKLGEFNIDGKIVNVLKGPIVDTFELELGAGVRVGKVEGFEDDIGLALQGVNVRIVPQMKGKSTMGIEVPRNMREREVIYLDQILNSPEFQKTTAQLPLAMGKDVFGKPAITDLATLPHLLVAGTTGSGKSVYLNSILVSLLVKKSPSQMKLILIDPKRVELAMFSKLPHLLMPTITDHKKAAVAFLWAIEEMERRYQILLEAQVKNIVAFNDKLVESKKDPQFIADIKKFYPEDKSEFHLPYIVIVIDEFANLISSNSGKEIEQSISTLAAKARASGIHLILATQRPSVDVVSGIVKTNFPTRIAFRVASPQDSKTILNLGGAEKLLGRGDMLFLKDADMLRMHSAYIVDEEIEATTKELTKLEVEYDQSALEMLEREAQESNRVAAAGVGGIEEDEFYPKALDLVLQTRTASATMLQRRLGIGYPRAGKLIDMLEANGVISPPDGAKPRKVLITSGGSSDTER